MAHESTPLEFPVYLSINSAPITWAWLVKSTDTRKNSVTNFFANSAETALCLEKAGLNLSIDTFKIDNRLFVDAYSEPRLRSIKKAYTVTVMPDSHPRLYNQLKDVSREDGGKQLMTLVDFFLVALWGQVNDKSMNMGKINPPDGYKSVEEINDMVRLDSADEAGETPNQTPAKSRKKEPKSSEKSEGKKPEEKPDPKPTSGNVSDDNANSKINELFGGKNSDSNLDDWS